MVYNEKVADEDINRTRLYGIAFASEFLDRRPATIRWWEGRDDFPVEMHPARDSRGWRLWTMEQLLDIRDVWLVQHPPTGGLARALEMRGIDPAKADLPPEQLKSYLEGLRKPRVLPKAA
jgi:hypothetical protein